MNHATEGTLQAYVDGELEAFEHSALERHLEACSACVAELEGLRAAGARFASAVRMLDEGATSEAVVPMPLSLRTRRVWHGPHRTLARAATIIVALGLSAALVEATTGAV
ncbi:MAG TPA: zf-HC2 domain-containing protein, partial [Longimicrobiales bacterium]|nr:zf-HC2 domain-containing protein [Longimicrobiales bacterium]